MKPKPLKRVLHDQAFRDKAVGVVLSGRQIAQVARDLGVNASTLSDWVNKARRQTVIHAEAMPEHFEDFATTVKKGGRLASLMAQRDLLADTITQAQAAGAFQTISPLIGRLTIVESALQHEVDAQAQAEAENAPDAVIDRETF